MEVVSKSAEETKEFGRKVANKLIADGLKLKAEKTNILALSGDLGSGKTTFVQGLAEGLGIEQRVVSPTFIIMRSYSINPQEKDQKLKAFYHMDLYRLESNFEQEITNLGLKEIWSDPTNIVAIEWAEKIEDLIPRYSKWIYFDYLGDNKRKIKIG